MSKFGRQAYIGLIGGAASQGFSFRSDPLLPDPRSIFLRHDVDLSISDAREIAEVDYELGIQSNFYLLCRSDFYSITSRTSQRHIDRIVALGHNVGLHFDPTVYSADSSLTLALAREIELLEWIVGKRCFTISQHQPSLFGLINWRELDGIIDVYEMVRARKVDYLSDSNMRWRQEPTSFLATSTRLQLLLHPEYWIGEDQDLGSVITRIVNSTNRHSSNVLGDELVIMNSYLETRSETDSNLINKPVPMQSDEV